MGYTIISGSDYTVPPCLLAVRSVKAIDTITLQITLHKVGARELTNQDSAGGKKLYCPHVSVIWKEGTEIRQLFSLEMALDIPEREFTIPKTISHRKK